MERVMERYGVLRGMVAECRVVILRYYREREREREKKRERETER